MEKMNNGTPKIRVLMSFLIKTSLWLIVSLSSSIIKSKPALSKIDLNKEGESESSY